MRRLPGTTQQEEDDDRRKLFVRTRKGDVNAQRELMEKYGMRVYSQTERSQLPTYYDSGKRGSPPSLTSSSSGKSVQKNRVISPGNEKRKAIIKKTPKRSRTVKKT